MTNTLHRFGDAESFRDDYIIFAIASRGKNDEGSSAQAAQFLEMALPFKPGESGRRDSRRRAAALQEHESDLALEARHDARFPGGDRRAWMRPPRWPPCSTIASRPRISSRR